MDGTIEIARKYSAKVYEHPFEGYASQRNWALRNLAFAHEWVFFLDADEIVSDELKDELTHVFAAELRGIDGFYLKRRLIFMGKWIKWGGCYPLWLLRIFRHEKTWCDARSVNEHFVVSGPTSRLRNDIIHKDNRGMSHWIEKHNKYAALEATEMMKAASSDACSGIRPRLFGSQPERKEWLRRVLWNRMPFLVRPFFYFTYRYILRLGILDGREGFIYHFLQGLWFLLLVDLKYIEMTRKKKR